MPDDYGFYGKGNEGYAHYMQAFNESKKGGGGGPNKNNNDNGGKGCAILIGVLILVVYLIVQAVNK